MDVAVATRGARKGRSRMGLFDSKPDPLDDIDPQLVRLSKRTWKKLDAIGDVLAARGVKSPVTKKAATRADVIREYVENGIAAFEAQHGPIQVSAEPPPHAEPAKKKAAKKGGK